MNRNEWQRGQAMKTAVRKTALAILTCMDEDKCLRPPYDEIVRDLLADERRADELLDAALDMEASV